MKKVLNGILEYYSDVLAISLGEFPLPDCSKVAEAKETEVGASLKKVLGRSRTDADFSLVLFCGRPFASAGPRVCRQLREQEFVHRVHHEVGGIRSTSYHDGHSRTHESTGMEREIRPVLFTGFLSY